MRRGPQDSEAPSIRRARPEDLPKLPAIEVAAASVFPEDVLPAHLRDSHLPLEVLEEARVAGVLLVAEVAAGLVGFVAARRPAPGCLHIDEIDVVPEHARRGIGRALLEALFEVAGEEGAQVTLTTYAHLPWNAPFYARCGFEALDEAALPAHLEAALAKDRAAGLPNRVAMRRPARPRTR